MLTSIETEFEEFLSRKLWGKIDDHLHRKFYLDHPHLKYELHRTLVRNLAGQLEVNIHWQIEKKLYRMNLWKR